MTEEETKTSANEKATPVSKRSGLMKILGSTKITPILGLAALLSILYYKNKSAKPKEKPKKVASNVDRRAPLLAPMAELGRTREGGPMLTRGYFSRGDLVLRKNKKGQLEAAVIEKKGKDVRILPLRGGSATPLLGWIKAGNGHFALLRIKLRSEKAWKKLTQAIAKHATQKLPHPRAVYTSAGLGLPAPLNDATLTRKQWLDALLKQSHYNDFAPTK